MREQVTQAPLGEQIASRLYDLGYPRRALVPYTGIPIGQINRLYGGHVDRDLGEKCVQILTDIKAGLLPQWKNISQYSKERTMDRKCSRYINNVRPPEAMWKNEVSVFVIGLTGKQIESIAQTHLDSPDNRLLMAYCRAIRRAGNLNQTVLCKWLGLKPTDISQLEMRDPFMYYGKPTVETRQRLDAYRETIDHLVYLVFRRPEAKMVDEDRRAQELVEPHVKTIDRSQETPEPEQLRETSLHIHSDGTMSSELRETRERLTKIHSERLKEVSDREAENTRLMGIERMRKRSGESDLDPRDIPEHVIIQRVKDDPALFLKIASEMNLDGVMNPALMPTSAEKINAQRADVMNRLSILAEGVSALHVSLKNRVQGIGTCANEIKTMFDDLLGSAPLPSSTQHANEDQRRSRYLANMAEETPFP